MADIIASFIMHLHADGTVTCSGVSQSPERSEHVAAVQQVEQAMPGTEVVQDPWATDRPLDQPLTGAAAPAPGGWQQPVQAQPAAQPQAPMCGHGQRRFVAAGVARGSGKPYPAFWACPADRSDPGKCKSLPA
jgi:hypothetical protein